MVSELGANRFAFLNPTGITIEYSRDGGSTWTNYGASDKQKQGLFSNGYAFSIGKADSTNKATANGNKYQLRILIDTGAAQVYTALNKIVLYVNTNGSNNCTVTLEKALQSTPTSFTSVVTDVPISGWSGWNVINISPLTTYGNTPGTQYGRLRFTFKANGGNTSYNGLYVQNIQGYGGMGWTTASNMAKIGHLYSYDADQNATFPAQVTAIQFNGNLNGNATTASALSNKTLNSTTINNTAGSFTFEGSGAPWDGTDWIGLQVGSGVDKFQLHADGVSLEYRQNDSGGENTADWGVWQKILSSGNYTDYTVTKIGTGASGTWGISISGNAATATKATQDAAGNDIQNTYLPKTTVATGTQYLQVEYKDNGIALGPSGLMRIPTVAYNTATPGYTSGGETFFKAAIKYIAQNYSTADVLIGCFTPNSTGPFLGHIYSNEEKDATTGLPRYSTFIYHNLNGGL